MSDAVVGGVRHLREMSYESALAAAGFVVHGFETFGSYQGDWWAKVTTPEGVNGWVHGWYGSCSGCDALESAFGYGWGADCPDKEHGWSCRIITDEQWAEWVDFGKSEGGDFYATDADALKKAGQDLSWDPDARDAVAFIRRDAWNADALPHEQSEVES